MTIVYEKVMALTVPPVEVTYGPKDCMLYALGVGLGQDPMNEDELAFVYEKQLKVLPTMATVLGYGAPGARARPASISCASSTASKALRCTSRSSRRRLSSATRASSRSSTRAPARAPSSFSERKVSDKASGELIATITQTAFCRGDGGFGGPPRQAPAPHPIPERAPDMFCDLPTRPEMALIYRLSGDYNPLHAEPAFAEAAGFPRPILHGLGTFGVSGHAVLKTLCGYDPNRLAAFAGRFSAPVFPGETIRTEMWLDGAVVSFRARVLERDVIAINNGRAEIRP